MTLVDRNIHIGSETLFIGLSGQVDRYHYLSRASPGFDDRLLAKDLGEMEQYDPKPDSLCV